LAVDHGLMIFLAVAAAVLVGAWVYAFSKGDVDQLDWVSLALRLAIFVLALLSIVVHLPALGWLALAAFLLWIATEIVAWRRRAPQRAEQRQLRQQHRDEVEAVLDHYRRTHASGDAARGSSAPPEGGT
jgi:chromate transport protein ChrA